MIQSLQHQGPRAPRPKWMVRTGLLGMTAALLLSGCGMPAHVEDRRLQGIAIGKVAPAPLQPAGSADPVCPAPTVSIEAPLADTPLVPGPALLVGTTATPGQLVPYSVRTADGVVAGAGFADDATVGGAGTFSVPLQLDVGTYTVTVGGGGECEQVTETITVTPRPADGALPWLSGASGNGVADGQFGVWRSTPLPIASTWADSNAGQLALWGIQRNDEYGQWQGDLDLAIGAIDRGETWAAAARGAYDKRWATSLQTMARLWGDRPGTVYIRFAHEFNGDWFPWSVTPASSADFVAAWKQFRALQQQYFPASKLVFAPNVNSAPSHGLDWRTAFPGSEYVDVMSVSSFNTFPKVTDATTFARNGLVNDATGAPSGILRHIQFARSVGLPFAVSEWGSDAAGGDHAPYMQQMFAFFNSFSGTGPGRLRYETLFNVTTSYAQFPIYPDTVQPQAAEAYRSLW